MMTQAPTHRIELVSCDFRTLSDDRKIKLSQLVSHGFSSLVQRYPRWKEAFPEGVADIDIGDIQKSPLFIVTVKLSNVGDREMIEAIKADRSMTTKHHGLSGESQDEIDFLSACWNSIIFKFLSVSPRLVQMPAN